MSSQHWGYGPKPDTVQVAVPTDMVEEVAAFVQNPEGFMAALARAGTPEEALELVMIEVEPGTWLDPKRIIAVKAAGAYSNVFLEGGGHLNSTLSAQDLFEKIAEKLSEAHARMLGITEGAPPA